MALLVSVSPKIPKRSFTSSLVKGSTQIALGTVSTGAHSTPSHSSTSSDPSDPLELDASPDLSSDDLTCPTAFVDRATRSGQTALKMAARNGHGAVVGWLCVNGKADVGACWDI